MILVDTSVWIDHFRGADLPGANWLARAIDDEMDLCICGLILTEILQGIASAPERRKVRRAVGTLIYLPMDRDGYLLAADLYRRARAKGRTIRNSVDCMIAACAIVNDAALLHNDRDFLTIAEVSKLRLVDV